ncbi:hypothetical protein S7711_06937 [Stachybotrys chartarum IBT 7711]|uniref:Geranylgeranyl pyrophosphate synthetase n=1 Tax=Stachybotrys chartarum (strain CBS 109288 / IBT 7711) TaxID=1280523 RepID=A0A084AL50_STACB|nr:hypothetical protein S7711_06937 [Stachybotrys chartarum IBT 7711]
MAHYRGSWRGRGGGPARRPIPKQNFPPPPIGPLIDFIDSETLETYEDLEGKGPVRITDVALVASYNWADKKQPEILVPGKPPRWTPQSSVKLREDDPYRKYYLDINLASYPKHALEAVAEAVMTMDPSIPKIQLYACASTMNNLLQFCKGESDRKFRMFVERMGDTVHLIRRQNSPLELLPGEIYGCGHTFPEAYTTWDTDVKQCKSHQRIIRYKLGDLNMMLRFEGDGFVADSKPAKRTSDDRDIDSLLGSLDVSPSTSSGIESSRLAVRKAGESIPQGQVFEIRTRTARARDRDIIGEELPRLWLRQLDKFVLAFHERGRFDEDDVKLHSIRPRLDEWEEGNQAPIKRLRALLREIIDQVKEQPSGRMELVSEGLGMIQICEQCADAERPLSDDAQERWEKWLARMK